MAKYNTTDTFLFMLGVTLPFPTLGVTLSGRMTLAPAIVFGCLYAVLAVARRGFNRTHVAATLMIVTFLATSLSRHQPMSYMLSLAALILAIAPITAPIYDFRNFRALLFGFKIGIFATIALLALEIIAQAFGISLLTTALSSVVTNRATGAFLSVNRPKAGFFEPADLAIYLCFSYVILDILTNTSSKSQAIKFISLISIPLTGSLSGIGLIAIYLLSEFVFSIHSWHLTRSKLATLVTIAFVSIAVAMEFSSIAIDLITSQIDRISRTILALDQGDLLSSEGSRLNVFVVLTKYWDEKGILGFLFGTGYGNYQQWVSGSYADLAEYAAYFRGDLNNLLVVVFISTGIFGMLSYLYFHYKIFNRYLSFSQMPTLIFLLAVQFSTGFLINYVYWFLLFCLAASLKAAQIWPHPPHQGNPPIANEVRS